MTKVKFAEATSMEELIAMIAEGVGDNECPGCPNCEGEIVQSIDVAKEHMGEIFGLMDINEKNGSSHQTLFNLWSRLGELYPECQHGGWGLRSGGACDLQLVRHIEHTEPTQESNVTH